MEHLNAVKKFYFRGRRAEKKIILCIVSIDERCSKIYKTFFYIVTDGWVENTAAYYNMVTITLVNESPKIGLKNLMLKCLINNTRFLRLELT